MKNTFTGSIHKKFFTVILLTVIPVILFSQEPESCAEKLRAAQSNFSRGQIEKIHDLLSGCLRSGFKKEEELAAYKLLIQTYLLEDKITEADSAMLSFLKKNPEYIISETDHSSFVNLYQNFNVNPVVMISLRAGTNFPFITIIRENSTSGKPVKSDFSADVTNLFLSAEAKFRIGKKLEAGAEIGYSQIEFRNTGQYLDFADFSYTEYQKRLEIPVNLTYEIITFASKFTAYGKAGAGAALNLSTTADAALYYNDPFNQDKTGETLKRNDSRSFLDIFIQLGGGIKYKIPKGHFFAEIRTNLGTLNQNSGGTMEINGDENHFYLYRDPDFRLNTLNINVGWTYIFYKPSKL